MPTLLIQLMIISLLLANVRSAAITHITQAENFLRQFGYVTDGESDRTNSISGKTFFEALRRFQTFNGLRVTGELDRATVAKMNAGRCGNPDIEGTDDNLNSKYVLWGSEWQNVDLTYKITRYTSDLTKSEVDNEIYEASKLWSDVSNITFRQVAPEDEADIEIKFIAFYHGDGGPFDGPGSVLAHAFSPSSGGDIHFDESETWSLDGKIGINLRIVAAHEFGHSLGISHSNTVQALMAPYYNPRTKDLHKDDKEAVQAIYGKGDETTTSAPPTTTTIPITTTIPTTTIIPTTTTTTSTTVVNGSISSMKMKNWSSFAILLMMLYTSKLL